MGLQSVATGIKNGVTKVISVIQEHPTAAKIAALVTGLYFEGAFDLTTCTPRYFSWMAPHCELTLLGQALNSIGYRIPERDNHDRTWNGEIFLTDVIVILGIVMTYLGYAANRVPDRIDPLERQFKSWSKEFEESFPQSLGHFWILPSFRRSPNAARLSLNPAEKESLTTFLSRIRTVKDYELGGRTKRNVIVRVENMLQLACTNPKFKEAMLVVLEQALETCNDRVLLCFNGIEVLYQFHCRELSAAAFKELAIREGRYEFLRMHGFAIHQRRPRRPRNDEVEIILYFHVKLRESLHLPHSSENMYFENMAEITNPMLDEAKNKVEALSEAEVLSYSPQWEKKMIDSYPDRCEAINDEYIEYIEDARQYFNQNKNTAFLVDNKLARLIVNAQTYPEAAKLISHEKNIEIARLGSSSI